MKEQYIQTDGSSSYYTKISVAKYDSYGYGKKTPTDYATAYGVSNYYWLADLSTYSCTGVASDKLSNYDVRNASGGVVPTIFVK